MSDQDNGDKSKGVCLSVKVIVAVFLAYELAAPFLAYRIASSTARAAAVNECWHIIGALQY